MIKFENNLGVKLEITLDRRCHKGGDWNEKYPEYPVKFKVKGPNDKKAFTVGDAITNKMKMHPEVFEKEIKKGANGLLSPMINDMVHYTNTINSLVEWGVEPFRHALKYKGSEKQETQFRTTVNQYIMVIRDSVDPSTVNKYNAMMNTIEKFNEKLPQFNEIDSDFLERFEKWYLTPDEFGKTYSNGGLHNHITKLRAIMNYAVDQGLITKINWPFSQKKSSSQYSVKPTGRKDLVIPLSLVKKIENEVDLTKSEKYHRDLYILSFYLNGMNLVDMLLLTWKQYDQENETISWKRNKNKHKSNDPSNIVARVSTKAKSIIEEYGYMAEDNDFIFQELAPIFNGYANKSVVKERIRLKKGIINTQINKVLKKVAKKHRSPYWKEVTYYTARRAFSNFLRDKANMNTSQIQKFLGHESPMTTEIYMGELPTDILDSVTKAFDKHLK